MTAVKATISLHTDNNGNRYPFSTENGILLEDKDIPEKLYISGIDCFHPEVRVLTNKKYIDKMMSVITIEKAKQAFQSVWNSIKNVKPELLYKKGGKNWSNFMDDIIIYYICRYKLFNKPIPMVDVIESTK